MTCTNRFQGRRPGTSVWGRPLLPPLRLPVAGSSTSRALSSVVRRDMQTSVVIEDRAWPSWLAASPAGGPRLVQQGGDRLAERVSTGPGMARPVQQVPNVVRGVARVTQQAQRRDEHDVPVVGSACNWRSMSRATRAGRRATVRWLTWVWPAQRPLWYRCTAAGRSAATVSAVAGGQRSAPCGTSAYLRASLVRLITYGIVSDWPSAKHYAHHWSPRTGACPLNSRIRHH